MLVTVPTARPPTCTLSPTTSWPAFSNTSVYSCPSSWKNSSQMTSAAMSATPSRTRERASVKPSLHAQGPLRCPGQELADELVVGVEQLLGRAGLDDPALPQHGDVLRDALGGHDVVRDHDVGAAVLLVD